MLQRIRSFAAGALLTLSMLTVFIFAPLALGTASNGSAKATLTFVEAIGTAPTAGEVTGSFTYAQGFSSGTSAGQINRAIGKQYSTAASGSETIDVRSTTDSDGTSITMDQVVCAVVDNQLGTTTLHVGNATSNQLLFFATTAAALVPVESGAILMKCYNTGYATGAGAKDLKILNTSGSTAASFKVFILGRDT